MKWNWGKGIVLSFILFCGFVIWIVVQAFQEDFDLVSNTYYEDELVYQQRIDQKANLKKSGLRVAVDQTLEEVSFSFPDDFHGALGQIRFYHPSREIFDKLFDIELNEANEQVIKKEGLVKGRYKVQIDWTVGEKGYYQEEEIFLK